MSAKDLPTPDYAQNMRLIGHSDQGGRADGVQLMVHRGYAYIGQMFSKGFSVIDVRDPSRPHAVAYIAAPPNTWNIHLQTHDDLLLVIHAQDMFAAPEFQDERAYYSGALGEKLGSTRGPAGGRSWSAGLAVYDISRGADPRQIGFMRVEGGGIHRIWYTGGRWAYVSALLDGHENVVGEAVEQCGDVGPAPADIPDPMNSSALDRHETDLSRVISPADVVHGEAGRPRSTARKGAGAAEFFAERAAVVGPFVLKLGGGEHVLRMDDEQEIVMRLEVDIPGVGRRRDVSNGARPRGVTHVDDAEPLRKHMPDIGIAAVDHQLNPVSPAALVRVPDQAHVSRIVGCWQIVC